MLVVAVGVAINQVLNNGQWAWWWLGIALVLAVVAAVVTHKAAGARIPARQPPEGSAGTRNVFSGGTASQLVQAQNVTLHQTFGDVLSASGLLPPVTQVDGAGLVGLPRRPAQVFVGRDDALMAVGRTLKHGQAGVITQAVVGLGGVGKSELALHYAHARRGDYDLVWWLLAETSEDIQAGLAGLGRALAAPVSSAAAAQAPAPEAAAWALAWLAAHDRWLLVFDNAEHPDDLQPYLGRLSTGHILITSRRAASWSEIGGTVLRLPVLSDADAAELLTRALTHPGTTPAEDHHDRDGREGRALHELAGELGGLPLALRQAAAYIAATPGMTATEYLRRLRESPRWALAATPTGPAGHSSANRSARSDEQVVAATWEVTMARIGQDHPVAPRVLRLMACFAPDALPVHVLYRLPDHDSTVTDQTQVEQALAALLTYSMIDQDPGRRHVSVHRLVQAVTQAQLNQADKADDQATATKLLVHALPNNPETITSWPAFAELLPHATHLLAPHSPAMATVLDYLDVSGDYRTGRDLQRARTTALHNIHGPDHPDTLAARHKLAYWTGWAGDPVAARDLNAELLPIRERVQGPDHPDTLTIRNSIAYWTGRAGDPATARDLLAELLPIRERVQGPDHPDTLTTRTNLARWTGWAGDPVTARDLFAELLPIHERVLGPDHPDTLTTRQKLAYWTGWAGDPVTARDLLAELLPIRERVQGPDHPDTLTTRTNLARWTGWAGDPVTARDLFAELLPIHERVLGPDHPDTLTTRSNLAYWRRKARFRRLTRWARRSR